ncbi:hypothetical protein KY342_06485 [Candidatus Woesearchaeota archaeon]|nr:hypothetical protein [Candidatus Woesearchaeota archaeon]
MTMHNRPKRRTCLLVGLTAGAVLGWYFSPNINGFVEKAKETFKGLYSENIENRVNDTYKMITGSIDQKIVYDKEGKEDV